jgi:hypothetical protein
MGHIGETSASGAAPISVARLRGVLEVLGVPGVLVLLTLTSLLCVSPA